MHLADGCIRLGPEMGVFYAMNLNKSDKVSSSINLFPLTCSGLTGLVSGMVGKLGLSLSNVVYLGCTLTHSLSCVLFAKYKQILMR